MEIRDYKMCVDMTPKMEYWTDIFTGQTWEIPVFTPAQKRERDRQVMFLQAEVFRFIDAMRQRDDFYIITEDGRKEVGFSLFEHTMLNIHDWELPQCVGLDTRKGHVAIDASYCIYWG